MQRRQKTLERASRQRLLGRGDLARGEGVQAVPLVDALGLVGEEHGIAVEGDAQTLRRLDALPDVGRQDRRGRMPRVQGLAHIHGIGGEKQMRIERRHVGIGVLPPGEGRARDVELVVLDRVHDAHPRVGGVARKQDHFHPGSSGRERVEPQELPHQRERDPGREDLVLVLELIPVVGGHALLFEHPIRFLQIEQSPGGDGDDQLTVEGRGHLIWSG